MTKSPLAALALSVGLASVIGCSGRPSRVSQPTYASGAGAAALEAYDSNGDGFIDGGEFDKVPSLRAALGQVDANGDGKVSAEEIDNRIAAWRESRVGLMGAAASVRVDGRPLAGAQVDFEPEPFIGSGLPSGSGVTDKDGFASVGIGPGTPFMPPGFYKIRVTSNDVNLPARYNAETTLGCEVANYSHWTNDGAVKLRLSTK